MLVVAEGQELDDEFTLGVAFGFDPGIEAVTGAAAAASQQHRAAEPVGGVGRQLHVKQVVEGDGPAAGHAQGLQRILEWGVFSWAPLLDKLLEVGGHRVGVRCRSNSATVMAAPVVFRHTS